MDKPFHQARLKIEWAKKHINDLNRIFEGFTNRKTHLVFIEHDMESGDDLLKVKSTQPIDEDFLLTLGDALHNLRSALDYVMNDIEFAVTAQRTTFTKFPVYLSRDHLEAAANGALKDKAPKVVVDCLLETIQPYKGGHGHAIWCLHELDIEDKHRLLIANAEFKFIDGICLEDNTGKEEPVGPWSIVPGEIAHERYRADRQFNVKDQGHATYRVQFGGGVPFAGSEIIPTLHNLVEEVEYTVNEIEYCFLSSQIVV